MFQDITTYAEQLRGQYKTALLNKNQAARELSISIGTLDRLRKSGEIKSQQIGQQIRFNVMEVARIVIGK